MAKSEKPPPVRAWFNRHGWRLEPAALTAALTERGADEDTIIELIDEGADRRRAQPAPDPEPEPQPRNGSDAERTGRSIELDAETYVLSAMMLAPAAVGAVTEILRPDGSEFEKPSYGTIYRAMLGLYSDNQPVEPVPVIDRLDRDGHLGDAGGRVRVHEIAALAVASPNVAHYAHIVRRQALLRSLDRAAREIQQRIREPGGLEAEQIVDQAGELVYQLASGSQQAGSEPAAVSVKQTFERMSALAEAGSDIVGTPTGLRDLDRITAGLEPGNLIVLAARPSMGKSGLALTIAADVGLRQQLPVAIFSLEMSRHEIQQRLLSRQAHVNLGKLRRPGRTLGQDEWTRLAAAANTIAGAPLFLNDTAVSLLTIRTDLRRLKTRHPDFALVVVDYLQLLAEDAENRTQEITKISRGLKLIARDLDVPIIALSQLNRNVEARTDKRPQLADLRESGSIEQDADLVWLLYRDHYYHPDTEHERVAELQLAKHRNGPTGKIELAFVPDEASFTDLHEPGVF